MEHKIWKLVLVTAALLSIVACMEKKSENVSYQSEFASVQSQVLAAGPNSGDRMKALHQSLEKLETKRKQGSLQGFQSEYEFNSFTLALSEVLEDESFDKSKCTDYKERLSTNFKLENNENAGAQAALKILNSLCE